MEDLPSEEDNVYRTSEEKTARPRRQAMVELENMFLTQIAEARAPPKFKMPRLKVYIGRTDTADHFAYFVPTTSLLDIHDSLKCHLFFITCKELA